MVALTALFLQSLDGYVADASGAFDWAEPDEEIHAFVNDLERPVGTYLYGRRLYGAMASWETVPDDETIPQVERDYAAVWRAADKVVFSTTLERPTTARTRLVRSFDTDEVRQMKAEASADRTIGGPTLVEERRFRYGTVYLRYRLGD